jgi:FKBP-type peptidyl-prolyl cis-trans isomerase FklB
MNRRVFAAIALVLASGAWINGQDQAGTGAATPPPDMVQTASYILGYNFAQEFKDNNIEIDVAKLIEGIEAAIQGRDIGLTDQEIQTCMTAFERVVQERQITNFKAAAEKNLREGEAFLNENRLKEGVKQTESGLQYKVLAEGTGATPTVQDRVKVHYHGTSIEGVVFDTSREGEPAVFSVAEVIRGMTEALQLMKVGDKWQLFIPASLAYGVQGSPPVIGPNQTLVFEVELLEVIPPNK